VYCLGKINQKITHPHFCMESEDGWDVANRTQKKIFKLFMELD
jgi:hypothetical protein